MKKPTHRPNYKIRARKLIQLQKVVIQVDIISLKLIIAALKDVLKLLHWKILCNNISDEYITQHLNALKDMS